MLLNRPALLLRIEEFVLLACTVALYHHLHFNWLLFAILFLAPDLFMLGYLVNVRVGSAMYNLGHTLTFPLVLLAVFWKLQWPTASAIALIWIAHIPFDRLLGYGLKYPTRFNDTHLQHIP
ncbi:DUF4260 domain-containing protein [soil metagenome]